MNLLDLLKLDCIKVPLDHTEKMDVIGELVDTLAAAHGVRDAQTVKEAVWSREKTRTTGIGQGLAIPHAKSEICDHLLMAVGKPVEPIDFDSIDHQPVKLIFLLISPPDRTSEHIQTLARISRLMTISEFREAIYSAQSADEVYHLFKEYEQAEARA